MSARNDAERVQELLEANNREVERRRKLEHEAGVMLGFLFRATAGHPVELQHIRHGLARLGLAEHGRPGEHFSLSERGNALLAQCASIEAKEEPVKETLLDRLLGEVRVELASARRKHKLWPTAHHGHGCIQEEVDELWAEVKSQSPVKYRMRHECLQIAACAIRFCLELCLEDESAEREAIPTNGH